MKKFQFRLEPVLKHRGAREEKAALEQARAQEEYMHNYQVLCNTMEKLEQAAQGDQAMDQFDLFNTQAYCSYMTQEVRKQEAVLHSSGQKLAGCRKKLIKAMQERSIIEKLKENQLQSYNKFVASFVQKECDEIATQQFLLRNK
ncbi:flagellar export protein FliJ [Desulfoscipio sp. XC116]|uniref:flagellar export protein FliJ n=1 Tax=Desulfoscipio sp. XC116 TaxID=3144975 RepID=UPI00325B2F93